MQLVLYTDGGARGNPGPAALGYVCYEREKKLFSNKRYLGERTNNGAEYEALIAGLEEIHAKGFTNAELEVRMDSELIVRQMQGVYKVKHQDLKILHARAQKAAQVVTRVSYTHIPREKNKEADGLVNEAIDEALGA
jgi:ribonuclease HI